MESMRISRFVNHNGTPNKRARHCRALSAAFAHRIYKGCAADPSLSLCGKQEADISYKARGAYYFTPVLY